MNGDYVPLFQPDSLEGWRIVPRGIRLLEKGSTEYEAAWEHKGLWTIHDGVVEGRQDPPGCGFGSYLVSEKSFGDFELIYEAKPDWPADTGVYLRASEDGFQGYQVLLDYRRSGNIGGFYGNSLGGFHAVSFTLDAELDDNGVPLQLLEESQADSLEPITPKKTALLQYSIRGEEFLKIWKLNDWNEFRVVMKGLIPIITTYINGVKVAEIDLTKAGPDRFDRKAAEAMGARGHIALEVHDNDSALGKARWGENASCRWRNMRIREI
ncbi:MAG: DUF1080 domain-containing protein [Oscillospiraceae bacterium]|nr:DUF1080 domain-containing protein [Oscillospiraceae bacterium]